MAVRRPRVRAGPSPLPTRKQAAALSVVMVTIVFLKFADLHLSTRQNGIAAGCSSCCVLDWSPSMQR